MSMMLLLTRKAIIYLDKAIYSEWGEVIEETDITGLDWEETKELLEGKYPEFTFWREG